MRVLRIYHGGRDATHRERDRALVRAGIDVTLIIPTEWPEVNSPKTYEPFEIVEMAVVRAGDVNRHRYDKPRRIADLVARLRPDVVDLHEEPFSSVVHQVLRCLPPDQRIVAYAAQNIDKRFPPPFAQWERQALRRIDGAYPCTRQAASVLVGKGFRGSVAVLPLASPADLVPGTEEVPTDAIRMLLVGRLVPEKGVIDAVRVLAAVLRRCPATLEIVGSGPEGTTAKDLAAELGVAHAVTFYPWLDADQLIARYRRAHVLLAPSHATRTWVEQFGRMIVEAHAAGVVVVGYASGSLPEVVGDAGVLVPEGDIDRLAEGVVELRTFPERWRLLRAAGLAEAETRSWDAVAAGQVKLYDAVSKGAQRHRTTRPQRALAVATYGEPATIAGGGRPFAIPVLRENTAMSRKAARVIDALSRREKEPERTPPAAELG